MKKWIYVLVLPVLAIASSCKSKKAENKKQFISIKSFFINQIAHVDTSFYFIKRLDIIDSLATDTTYIRREDFRNEARDFLELPDIADPKYSDDYREENHADEMMQSMIITYLPEKPEKAVIQRQEMVVSSGNEAGRVKSLFIDYLLNTRDSVVQKRMLWLVDKSFQVTTIKQKAGEAETITTKRVIWNEPEDL